MKTSRGKKIEKKPLSTCRKIRFRFSDKNVGFVSVLVTTLNASAFVSKFGCTCTALRIRYMAPYHPYVTSGTTITNGLHKMSKKANSGRGVGIHLTSLTPPWATPAAKCAKEFA